MWGMATEPTDRCGANRQTGTTAWVCVAPPHPTNAAHHYFLPAEAAA